MCILEYYSIKIVEIKSKKMGSFRHCFECQKIKSVVENFCGKLYENSNNNEEKRKKEENRDFYLALEN